MPLPRHCSVPTKERTIQIFQQRLVLPIFKLCISGVKQYVLFLKYLFIIYLFVLAALGLSCSMWDL